jgi:Ca-activated chloride channel family protein
MAVVAENLDGGAHAFATQAAAAERILAQADRALQTLQDLDAAIGEDLTPGGGTAMYDGIVLGLAMLDEQRALNPDVKPILVVLSDGETTDGLQFEDVDDVIEGLRIPIYTVGFEADLEELARVSSLVEAASIDASEEDVEFKIAALFNAGG